MRMKHRAIAVCATAVVLGSASIGVAIACGDPGDEDYQQTAATEMVEQGQADPAPEAEPAAESQAPEGDQAEPAEPAAPAAAPADEPAAEPAADASAATPAEPAANPAAGNKVVAAGKVMTSGLTNPNVERIASPNPSPVANAANLKGPKVHIGCADNPEKLNGMTLAAGTVVEFERGCTWPDVRVTVNGNGTAAQPILLHATGAASKPAPVFGAKKGGDGVDGGVITLKGSNIHVSGIALANSESVGIRVEGPNAVLDNVVGSELRIGAWITGDGAKVWNTYFHDLNVRVVEGAHNDYGATGVVVEANNVTIEGLTCRNCFGSSPDYDQYGGDGSFVEVWQKGDNLKVNYGYVDSSARVYEAGSMGSGSQNNVTLSNIFARDIKDQPVYVNNEGKYQIGGGNPKVTGSSLNGQAS